MKRALPLVLCLIVAVAVACGKKDSPTSPSGAAKSIDVTGDLNFGSVVVGSNLDKTIQIKNTGSETVTVSSISMSNATVFAVSWGSGTIAKGGTQNVTVRFTPTEAKAYGGTLHVNGDHTAGTDTLSVIATGSVTGLSFNLTGTVSETAPTASTRVPGATVIIADGADAGKTTTAGGDGTFTFTGLKAGDFNIRAEAANYQSASAGVHLDSNKTVTLGLKPNPKTIDETFTGQISAGDSTCSDGTFTKPCKRISLPIHNSGLVVAKMEFTGGSNDLDIGLWSNGSLLVRSAGVTGREEISTNVSGGGSYELRITYYEGSTVSTYTVNVTRPN